MAPTEDPPRSWLVVSSTRSGQLVYEAGWRHRAVDGNMRTMKRRLGSAWLEPGPDGEPRRRRGRPKAGYLDEHAAIVAKDQLVRAVERELAGQEDAADRARNAPPSFPRCRARVPGVG